MPLLLLCFHKPGVRISWLIESIPGINKTVQESTRAATPHHSEAESGASSSSTLDHICGAGKVGKGRFLELQVIEEAREVHWLADKGSENIMTWKELIHQSITPGSDAMAECVGQGEYQDVAREVDDLGVIDEELHRFCVCGRKRPR